MSSLYPIQAGAQPAEPVELSPAEQALVASLQVLSEPALVTRSELAPPGPAIIGVSPALCALTGYTAAELFGRTPRVFQGPLTQREVIARLRELCGRGERFVGETVNYRKDGTPYLVHWCVNPLRDDSGRVTHFISRQMDITGQHALAREWLDAEQRARAALTQASEQMAAIAEAILVLEKTKRNFRSKELGELRQRLVQASRIGAAPSAPPERGTG